jgi:hypothetical protein
MTDEQRVMKQLLEEHCRRIGVTLVKLLSWDRRIDEPLGDCIERLYKKVEADQTRKVR